MLFPSKERDLKVIENKHLNDDFFTLELAGNDKLPDFLPGQFVQVDFHGERRADSVELEAAPNQSGVRLRLEGQDGGGRWQTLAAAPTPSDAARPLGLRRAVAGELKRRGIDYLLVFDTDEGADDLRLNADLWGMRAVGDYKGARLYQLP